MAATSACWSQGGKHLGHVGTWWFWYTFIVWVEVEWRLQESLSVLNSASRNWPVSQVETQKGTTVISTTHWIFGLRFRLPATRVGCRLTLNLEKMLVFFWNRPCTCTLAELSQTGFNRRSKWKLYPYLTMNLLNWSHATGCVVFRCSITKRKVSILEFWSGHTRLCNFGGFVKPPFSESNFVAISWGWKQRQTHWHPGRLGTECSFPKDHIVDQMWQLQTIWNKVKALSKLWVFGQWLVLMVVKVDGDACP